MLIPLLIGWFRLRSLHTFVLTCVREARPFSDFPGQPSGPHGTMSSQTLSDVKRLITALSADFHGSVERNKPFISSLVFLH